MMIQNMKPFTAIAILIFSLIACAQLLRFLFRVEVIASGITIPIWPSAIAAVIFGVMAYMLWRENRPKK
jgi:hypothetical protein